MSSLEEVWEQREEAVYPQMFGTMSRGMFPLAEEIFTDVFGQSSIDPLWLHHGVFEFAPSPTRNTWLYVTSGTSTPWHKEPSEYDAAGYSGIGSELVLETPEQADWPVHCLRKLLAYNLLLAYGRFGDPNAFDYGSRVPLGGPIDGGATSELRFVVLAEPAHFAPSFQLPSGRVDLLQVVAISEAERDLAKVEGSDGLVERLKAQGVFPTIDATRRSIA